MVQTCSTQKVNLREQIQILAVKLNAAAESDALIEEKMSHWRQYVDILGQDSVRDKGHLRRSNLTLSRNYLSNIFRPITVH
jgi:hypothetical protein